MADRSGEGFGVGAAEHETFCVDCGVDRFGEQGVGEGGVVEGTVGEGFDDAGESVDGGAGVCGCGDGVDFAAAQVAEDADHEVGFVGVVPVDGASGDTGTVGDGGDGQSCVAGFGEQGDGGCGDGVALGVESLLNGGGSAVGHTKY